MQKEHNMMIEGDSTLPAQAPQLGHPADGNDFLTIALRADAL